MFNLFFNKKKKKTVYFNIIPRALQRLQNLQEEAKKYQRGVWTTSQEELRQAIPKIKANFDATDFYTKQKGNKLVGIVEAVINGSMLRVLVLPFYREILLRIGGVQSPQFKKQGEEPFGKEAQWTTERYILQRKIDIRFTGTV